MTPEVALRKVKDKVDIAMSDPSFPDDLPSDPNIFDLNFTELVPVMQVNLSGDYPIDQLEDYAEILQERIEDVEQINEAEIRGVNAKEMEVEVDHLRAEAMLVSFNDIAQAIGQENLSISGGDILMDGRRRTVQVVGDFRDAQDLESIIVKAEGGTPVYLRDVANVKFVDQEATSFAREWGNPVVSLDVRKRAGENLIIASDEINRIIEEAKAEFLPSDLNVSITSDQSDQTRTQVDELQNSIILGVLLVVGVLVVLPRVAQRALRRCGDSAVHVPQLRHPQRVGNHLQRDGALCTGTGARHARGQRHRGGREHLPIDGRGHVAL